MIAVGVDTHKQRHYAVALDQVGQLLAEPIFEATAAGYRELQRWAERLADAGGLVFGLEGTGSWGAGLFQHLQRVGHPVVEVERPRRKDRRAGSQTGSTRSPPPSACSAARTSPPRVAEGFSPPSGRC